MSILAPTRPGQKYGPPPKLGVTPEAGGFTATCACGHLTWWPDQKHAATEYAKHEAKCKGAPVKAEPAAPKPRAKTDWNGRDGATWIDKL